VNGIVGLMATGGSTNLLIHLIAMARASGIILDWSDFAGVSGAVPLLTRVYPNGLADVNHFHAAGGLGLVISELLNADLLHDDTTTITGEGLNSYTKDQKSVLDAFRANEFTDDVIVVVRYQGPRANGMPELHNLTPCLAVLQERGHKVALVTDGRMSGASGKVPAAIHVTPEALDDGPLAFLQDGDIVTVDAAADASIFAREITHPDLSDNSIGLGRELFNMFRDNAGPAEAGASVFKF